jgi:hypothetical protein
MGDNHFEIALLCTGFEGAEALLIIYGQVTNPVEVMEMFYLNIPQKMCSCAIKKCQRVKYHITKLLLLNFSIKDAIAILVGGGNFILTSYSTCTAQSASAYIL